MIKTQRLKGKYVLSIYKDTYKYNGRYKNWSMTCFGNNRFKTYRKAVNFAQKYLCTTI